MKEARRAILAPRFGVGAPRIGRFRVIETTRPDSDSPHSRMTGMASRERAGVYFHRRARRAVNNRGPARTRESGAQIIRYIQDSGAPVAQSLSTAGAVRAARSGSTVREADLRERSSLEGAQSVRYIRDPGAPVAQLDRASASGAESMGSSPVGGTIVDKMAAGKSTGGLLLFLTAPTSVLPAIWCSRSVYTGRSCHQPAFWLPSADGFAHRLDLPRIPLTKSNVVGILIS